MTAKRLPPINKRWPGQWAIRATIYAPSGKSVLCETDLTEPAAEKLLALLTEEATKKEKPSTQRSSHVRKKSRS